MFRGALVLASLAILISGCGPGGDLINYSIRSFLYEPFRMPSESMAPTLLVGDHLFVDKSEYGSRPPSPGEVAVFFVSRSEGRIKPADREPDWPREPFMKRVVAGPGDTVETREGVLFVNGLEIPEKPTGAIYQSKQGNKLGVFTSAIGKFKFELVRDPSRKAPEIPFTKVESGRYFVLGDNRENSHDSRYWGTVHHSDFVGPATYIYLSSDDRDEPTLWKDVHAQPADGRRITSP